MSAYLAFAMALMAVAGGTCWAFTVLRAIDRLDERTYLLTCRLDSIVRMLDKERNP